MDSDRLQILWDHLQINQALATYCRAIDRCDNALLKTVYWPDAYEDHGIFRGKAWDFVDYIVPLLKSMKGTAHRISNTLIDLQGDRASVETYCWAYHLLDGEDGRQSDLIVGGRYLDQFERRKDQWRIAERIWVLDWNQNQPASCQWDTGLYIEMRNRGGHYPDDISYELLARGKK